MLEGLKEALQYVVGLGNSSEKVQVVEICGETYANRRLERYGAPKRAEAVEASTLSSMAEYISRCSEEFKGNKMIIHVESPKLVSLVSFLDGERKGNAFSPQRQKHPNSSSDDGMTRKSS